MWIYRIVAATIEHSDRGSPAYPAYSGTGAGRNNPDMQAAVGVGPIPTGDYYIDPPYDSQHTGPYTLALVPAPGTNTLGRDAFRIHGDNRNHDASHGCIVTDRSTREQIWASNDHLLRVVV